MGNILAGVAPHWSCGSWSKCCSYDCYCQPDINMYNTLKKQPPW